MLQLQYAAAVAAVVAKLRCAALHLLCPGLLCSRFAPWLGWWGPELDHITSQVSGAALAHGHSILHEKTHKMIAGLGTRMSCGAQGVLSASVLIFLLTCCCLLAS